MTGLRAQQRAERREKMIAAAARLFDRQGYARTTFEQIAAACDMGVATVYKYFGSKEGIVKALLEPDLARILRDGERIIANPPADPVRAVTRLLMQYGDLGGHHWARRDLLRMTIFPGIGNEGVLGALVVEADTRTRLQIRRLMTQLRTSGGLARDLDLESASSVIFAVFNQHFAEFLTREGLPYTRMFSSLSRHIRVLFACWRPTTIQQQGKRR